MYYRGGSIKVNDGKLKIGPEAICYAESRDGIHFEKPVLGLFEHNGSKENNICWNGVGVHNFAPFLDTSPDCPAESRFKALGGLHNEGCLFAFKSPDGIHWSLLRKEPVVTEGAFDSQNLAFWDAAAGKYRAYFRTFTGGVTTKEKWAPSGFRAVRTASSRDFLSWHDKADLTYKDSPVEHLYTNQIGPYARAPHILIGFPARYVERGWSPSMRNLPQLKQREQRSASHLRYGASLSEGLLMASRDGVHFERWNEAFLRPGAERPGTWLYGHQFIAWNTAETKSNLPGAANELSLYATEGEWNDDAHLIRRYTLRLDGFVSVNAGWKGGEMLTKPMVFDGSQLELNFSSSAVGMIRVEIQLTDGTAIPGFRLEDCHEIFGDSVDRTVSWEGSPNLRELAGRAIRLRIRITDADLYSYRFK